MRLPALCLTYALLTLSTTAHADDTLRCNGAIVSVGDSTAVVLHKCGTPSNRSDLGTIKTQDGQGQLLSLPASQWTYGPNGGSYNYLRFEGDRLVKIESGRG